MNKIELGIKLLHPDAKIPKYQYDYDSGFDLESIDDVLVLPTKTVLVKTGISFDIPVGYEIQIRPRSGISLNTPLIIKNSPGTIDMNFRGEVKIIISNIDNIQPYHIHKGDRIAQAVIVPVIQAIFKKIENLSLTDRTDKGFGSTGL